MEADINKELEEAEAEATKRLEESPLKKFQEKKETSILRVIHEDGEVFTSKHCFIECLVCKLGMLVLLEDYLDKTTIILPVHKNCEISI